MAVTTQRGECGRGRCGVGVGGVGGKAEYVNGGCRKPCFIPFQKKYRFVLYFGILNGIIHFLLIFYIYLKITCIFALKIYYIFSKAVN